MIDVLGVHNLLDLFENVFEDANHTLNVLDVLEIPQIVVVLCALNVLDAEGGADRRPG